MGHDAYAARCATGHRVLGLCLRSLVASAEVHATAPSCLVRLEINKIKCNFQIIFLKEKRIPLWGTVPSVGNVAQHPLGKASGERGSGGRTHAHR